MSLKHHLVATFIYPRLDLLASLRGPELVGLTSPIRTRAMAITTKEPQTYPHGQTWQTALTIRCAIKIMRLWPTFHRTENSELFNILHINHTGDICSRKASKNFMPTRDTTPSSRRCVIKRIVRTPAPKTES